MRSRLMARHHSLRGWLTWTVILCVLCAPGSGHAQETRIEFYHGASSSGALLNGEVSPDYPALYLSTGTKVCVDVTNANPALYTYSVSTEVDTTTSSPDISPIVSVLQALIRPSTSESDKKRTPMHLGLRGEPADTAAVAAAPAWLDQYLDRLTDLASIIKKGTVYLEASDTPESYREVDEPDNRRQNGFARERGKFRQLKRDQPVEWGDGLTQVLRGWHAEALRQAKNPRESSLVEMFRLHGEALREARDHVVSAFDRGSSPLCHAVGSGRTTFRVRVARRDSLRAIRRDVGAELLKVEVEPTLERASLELVPMVFVGFASDVPRFSVKDGVVLEESGDQAQPGVGSVLIWNAHRWGSRREWAAGIGLGVGVGGEDRVISDYLIGGVLSWRFARVGFGFFHGQMPNSLADPVSVGESLPDDLDVADLEDFVRTRGRSGFALFFALPGLDIPSPF